jgi:hypothetical protein
MLQTQLPRDDGGRDDLSVRMPERRPRPFAVILEDRE